MDRDINNYSGEKELTKSSIIDFSNTVASQTRLQEIVFNECFSHFSDQNLSLLRKYAYEYTMEDENPEKTRFFELHKGELESVAVFRRCFRREALSFIRDNHCTNISNLNMLIDHTTTMTEHMLGTMAESLIPKLELSSLVRLSGEAYEKAQAKGQIIVFFPSLEVFRSIPDAIEFHSDFCLELNRDAHAIRKQLNLCDEDTILAVAEDKMSFKTIGLAPAKVRLLYPSVCIKNHLHWELHLPTKTTTQCIVQFAKGLLRFPPLNLIGEYTQIALEVFKDKAVSTSVAQLLGSVKAEKGTSLVISIPEVIKQERKRLVLDNHRGTTILKEKEYHFKFDSKKKTNRTLLDQLSKVDGTLFIDSDGMCDTFGVILDGIAVQGDPSRGARFNSMLSYVEGVFATKYPNAPLLCAVFSEDGMVDIFSKKEHDTVVIRC